MTSTKLCCFFLSALWCSWVWSVKICRRVSASLRACSQEPFWGIRDEERRKQWRKPSWVSHTILWACEKVGMFIPAGLWDGGLLSWETITRNKPPSSQGDQHQRLPWAESVVKKKIIKDDSQAPEIMKTVWDTFLATWRDMHLRFVFKTQLLSKEQY